MNNLCATDKLKPWMVLVTSAILVTILTHELKINHAHDTFNLSRTEIIEEYVKRKNEHGSADQ